MDLVTEIRTNPDAFEESPRDLESLVPEAHALLADALKNDGSVSAARAKIALDILKAAQVAGRATPSGGAGSLASRLAELIDQETSD